MSTSPLPVTDPTSDPPSAMSRTQRLTLVALLYCTQNLSLGMFTYAFLTIAQANGVSLATIGAATGLATLLVLKFLWAPLVDRYGSSRLGHYRGWLLATQSLLAVGATSLALLDPAEDFSIALVIYAALFIVAGTQDVAADAATTRLLTPSDRGIGNGFQSAGSCVAQIVGGGLVLLVYGAAGWAAAALVLAVWSALPLPFVLAWNEKTTTATQPRPRVTRKTITQFFTRPGVTRWALFLLPVYTAGGTISYNLVRPMLVDAGWSESEIGTVVVIAGSAFGIVSGIAAGMFIRRLGRRLSLVALGLTQVAACLGTVALALGSDGRAAVILVVALSNIGFAASGAIVYTISMDLVRHESAGTDFTLFTTVSGIAMAVAGGLGIAAAGSTGFVPVTVFAALLAAVGVVVVGRGITPVLAAVPSEVP